jgi:uncharacterized protein YbaR (Trm112 family)
MTTCPQCHRDRVDVQMQLDEARQWSERDVLKTILCCPDCRTFFRRTAEQKQGVEA